MSLNGIDIASYQSTLVPSKMTTTDFIIIKATQGKSYTNPYFKSHYEAAKAAGKLLGIYHYIDGSGADAEAIYFVNAVKSVNGIGNAILAVDEESNQNAKFGNATYVKQLMDKIYSLTGIKPFLYISHSIAGNYNNIQSAGYPLWGAQYANMNTTNYQSSPWEDGKDWGKWGNKPLIRQYSSMGRITGYSGNLDLDIFYGTKDDWKKWANVNKSTSTSSSSTNTSTSTSNKETTTVSVNFSNYYNKISNSGGDQYGNIRGGKAGDNNGREWEVRNWYSYPWDCIIRHPDDKTRELIAELAIEAANNNKIGYDQYERQTYWNQLVKAKYRPSKITTACEADCSAGVIANVKAVGYLLGNSKLKNLTSTYTGNMEVGFKAAGFKILTDSKYLTSTAYLLPGDILLNRSHHTATNLGIGSQTGYRQIGSPDPTAGKTIDQLAQEVIDGKWGVGDYRKNALGSKYSAVQAKVDELLNQKNNGTTTTTKKNIEEIAKEVLANKWGTGDERKNALIKAGYNYDAVQAKVNELLKSNNSTTIPITTKKATVPAYKGGTYSKTVVRQGVVNVNILNIRCQPGTQYANLVSYPTLTKGTKVGVCVQTKTATGNWYYIKITGNKGEKYGFASSAYITLV